MRTILMLVLLPVLAAGAAGCMFFDDDDDGPSTPREHSERPRTSDGGTPTRDWCMTCGGSGSVTYVTTHQTEVCPTCHGSGVRN